MTEAACVQTGNAPWNWFVATCIRANQILLLIDISIQIDFCKLYIPYYCTTLRVNILDKL